MRKLILCILGGFVLAACGGGGGGGSTSTKATVSFVNLSPDASDLDFLLDGSATASAVGYKVNTSFIELSPREYDLSLRPTGDIEVAWSESATYTGTTAFTVGLGLLNFGTETEKRLRFATGTFNRTAPVGNRARLVVVNGFVRASGFQNVAVDLQTTEAQPLISSTNITYAGFRSLDVDSGTYTFQIRQNGTEQVFVQRLVTLSPAKVYLVMVSGQEGTSGATAPSIEFVEVPAS